MKYLKAFLLIIFLSNCNSQTLDINKINLTEPINNELSDLKSSKTENQKGHWEIIKKSDEVKAELVGDENSTHYFFRSSDEINQLNFDGIKLDDFPVQLVKYKDKLTFISLAFESNNTFKMLHKMKEMLGEPDRIYDSIPFNKDDSEVQLLLKELTFETNDLKESKDEYDDPLLLFPIHNVWSKNGCIYKFSLLQGRETYGNSLVVISEKALNDKIIFGYHNPKEDSIFKKYIN